MSLPGGASRPRTHQAAPGWLLGPHSPCTLPPVSLKARGTGSVHGGHAQTALFSEQSSSCRGSMGGRAQSWKGPGLLPLGSRMSLQPGLTYSTPHLHPGPHHTEQAGPSCQGHARGGGGSLCREDLLLSPFQAGMSLPPPFSQPAPSTCPHPHPPPQAHYFLLPLCWPHPSGSRWGRVEGRSRAPESPGHPDVARDQPPTQVRGQRWVWALPPSSWEE